MAIPHVVTLFRHPWIVCSSARCRSSPHLHIVVLRWAKEDRERWRLGGLLIFADSCSSRFDREQWRVAFHVDTHTSVRQCIKWLTSNLFVVTYKMLFKHMVSGTDTFRGGTVTRYSIVGLRIEELADHESRQSFLIRLHWIYEDTDHNTFSLICLTELAVPVNPQSQSVQETRLY